MYGYAYFGEGCNIEKQLSRINGNPPRTCGGEGLRKEVEMKKVLVFLMVVALTTGLLCTAYASKEDDAKALAQKVVRYILENGRDKGIAEIMNPAGRFKTMVFNVSVNDFDGMCRANTLFPGLVGQNHYTLKDSNGKPFIKDAIDLARAKGAGWVSQSFTNPNTKKIGRTESYVMRVGNMDMMVMIGFAAEK
jgi:cytochrome c